MHAQFSAATRVNSPLRADDSLRHIVRLRAAAHQSAANHHQLWILELERCIFKSWMCVYQQLNRWVQNNVETPTFPCVNRLSHNLLANDLLGGLFVFVKAVVLLCGYYGVAMCFYVTVWALIDVCSAEFWIITRWLFGGVAARVFRVVVGALPRGCQVVSDL